MAAFLVADAPALLCLKVLIKVYLSAYVCAIAKELSVDYSSKRIISILAFVDLRSESMV